KLSRGPQSSGRLVCDRQIFERDAGQLAIGDKPVRSRGKTGPARSARSADTGRDIDCAGRNGNRCRCRWHRLHATVADRTRRANAMPDETRSGEVKHQVDKRLLELLVCPLTKTSLVYDEKAEELISRAARLAYPIRDGIPIMLPDEARKLDDDVPRTEGRR